MIKVCLLVAVALVGTTQAHFGFPGFGGGIGTLGFGGPLFNNGVINNGIALTATSCSRRCGQRSTGLGGLGGLGGVGPIVNPALLNFYSRLGLGFGGFNNALGFGGNFGLGADGLDTGATVCNCDNLCTLLNDCCDDFADLCLVGSPATNTPPPTPNLTPPPTMASPTPVFVAPTTAAFTLPPTGGVPGCFNIPANGNCPAVLESRPIDGSCLNSAQTGRSLTGFLRNNFNTVFAYGNDLTQGPNPRMVSNVVGFNNGNVILHPRVSTLMWHFGQFLDHDVTEFIPNSPTIPAHIPVPDDDVSGFPRNTSAQVGGTMPFSPEGLIFDAVGNPFIQFVRGRVPCAGRINQSPENELTSFADASNVYGSRASVEEEVRAASGGLLRTETQTVPGSESLPLAPNAGLSGTSAFQRLAGDERVNEQPGLTAMHTLWVREHNRQARIYANANNVNMATCFDECNNMVFEAARRIVIAEMQAIVYNEFLVIMLGPSANSPSGGYSQAAVFDDTVDASTGDLFAHAAYRIGHTLINGELRFRDAANNIETISLVTLFNFPDIFSGTRDIDQVFRGALNNPAEGSDSIMSEAVRSNLFGTDQDLWARNVQRARDFNIPDYNSVRLALGLPQRSFADMANGRHFTELQLSNLYQGNVFNVDLWTGGQLEDSTFNGGIIGETFNRIITDQFMRAAQADSMFFEYPEAGIPNGGAAFRNTRIMDILMANTNIGSAEDQARASYNPQSGFLLPGQTLIQ